MRRIILVLVSLLLVGEGKLLAQAVPTFTPVPVLTQTPAQLSYDERKKKLELDRLELENEKLRFEMEKLKAQATKTIGGEQKTDSKKEIEAFQKTLSEKAAALAKENQEKPNLLILDLVNDEIWNKGVRYNAHSIFAMAEDRKLDMKKYLDKRDMNGDERNRYVINNLSLIRYSLRAKGIIKIAAPAKDGDFTILTSEGVTSDSPIGDVRNAYQSVYFKYNGEGERKKMRILKYQHSRGLDFSDKLEFAFDRDGKMMEIRFGVLDEN